MVATSPTLELVQRKAFKMTLRRGHPGLMGKMTPEELLSDLKRKQILFCLGSSILCLKIILSAIYLDDASFMLCSGEVGFWAT